MADQQFCLRWNNHQSTLISVFDTLLENGTLVDCTLAAEGQYLKAHKVVLCACSPYLEALLSQHYEKHPIVILKDVKFSELKSMMDYMYRGEVNISQDQLGTFLKAAESLQIKGLSDNGADGDARDVGSTPKAPPPRKPNVPAPSSRSEPARPDSPLTDGSMSPSSRKRRRVRRSSQDEDSHIENNCDLPSQAQSTPVPNIPAATSSITTTPIVKPAIVKPEQTEINRVDTNSLPADVLKKEIEPISEPLLEPKTEYLEDVNNEDSVEDLTLDDDDDMDGMDISNMSNMSNMSRPGPSHGNDISNQGFAAWNLGANQSGTDEVFMAAQEAVNQHRDSQDDVSRSQYSPPDAELWNPLSAILIPVPPDPQFISQVEDLGLDLSSSDESDIFEEDTKLPGIKVLKPQQKKAVAADQTESSVDQVKTANVDESDCVKPDPVPEEKPFSAKTDKIFEFKTLPVHEDCVGPDPVPEEKPVSAKTDKLVEFKTTPVHEDCVGPDPVPEEKPVSAKTDKPVELKTPPVHEDCVGPDPFPEEKPVSAKTDRPDELKTPPVHEDCVGPDPFPEEKPVSAKTDRPDELKTPPVHEDCVKPDPVPEEKPVSAKTDKPVELKTPPVHEDCVGPDPFPEEKPVSAKTDRPDELITPLAHEDCVKPDPVPEEKPVSAKTDKPVELKRPSVHKDIYGKSSVLLTANVKEKYGAGSNKSPKKDYRTDTVNDSDGSHQSKPTSDFVDGKPSFNDCTSSEESLKKIDFQSTKTTYKLSSPSLKELCSKKLEIVLDRCDVNMPKHPGQFKAYDDKGRPSNSLNMLLLTSENTFMDSMPNIPEVESSENSSGEFVNNEVIKLGKMSTVKASNFSEQEKTIDGNSGEVVAEEEDIDSAIKNNNKSCKRKQEENNQSDSSTVIQGKNYPIDGNDIETHNAIEDTCTQLKVFNKKPASNLRQNSSFKGSSKSQIKESQDFEVENKKLVQPVISPLRKPLKNSPKKIAEKEKENKNIEMDESTQDFLISLGILKPNQSDNDFEKSTNKKRDKLIVKFASFNTNKNQRADIETQKKRAASSSPEKRTPKKSKTVKTSPLFTSTPYPTISKATVKLETDKALEAGDAYKEKDNGVADSMRKSISDQQKANKCTTVKKSNNDEMLKFLKKINISEETFPELCIKKEPTNEIQRIKKEPVEDDSDGGYDNKSFDRFSYTTSVSEDLIKAGTSKMARQQTRPQKMKASKVKRTEVAENPPSPPIFATISCPDINSEKKDIFNVPLETEDFEKACPVILNAKPKPQSPFANVVPGSKLKSRHNKPTNFTCQYCCKEFSTRRTLKRHLEHRCKNKFLFQ
ncbi:titin-like isoform X1 [Macrosteles quadrilineatus]|uniref:titin-like isoform X1 n=1 Tax=Macrosteles quadrilineatus TaxID=74068 RepID=UPI0023E0AD2B|nr:titin-like isoform X1 [Macrosteles quadrilineatus]